MFGDGGIKWHTLCNAICLFLGNYRRVDNGRDHMAAFVHVSVHRGTALFDIDLVTPRMRRGGTDRMPGIFNLAFRYKKHAVEALKGGGIYAVFYRGELLYIGIYTGDGKAPFEGNVAEQRFWKHLEALTLRGRSVGFTDQNYDLAIGLAAGRPNCPLIRILEGTKVPRGNGSVKTYPCKVEFASDNWDAFKCIETNSALCEFTFTYGRVEAEDFNSSINYQDVKNYLGAIENELLASLNPRCNERFNSHNSKYLDVGPPKDVWSGLAETIRNQISNPRLPTMSAGK